MAVARLLPIQKNTANEKPSQAGLFIIVVKTAEKLIPSGIKTRKNPLCGKTTQ
jgi:hypothetical protein